MFEYEVGTGSLVMPQRQIQRMGVTRPIFLVVCRKDGAADFLSRSVCVSDLVAILVMLVAKWMSGTNGSISVADEPICCAVAE